MIRIVNNGLRAAVLGAGLAALSTVVDVGAIVSTANAQTFTERLRDAAKKDEERQRAFERELQKQQEEQRKAEAERRRQEEARKRK
jgi:membrane protein involved in colicin uptake